LRGTLKITERTLIIAFEHRLSALGNVTARLKSRAASREQYHHREKSERPYSPVDYFDLL
jgi:hypothetical protein